MAKLKYSLIVSKSTKFKPPKINDDLKGGKHQNLRVFNLNSLNLRTVRRCLFKYKDTTKQLSLLASKLEFDFFRNLLQKFPQITHLCLRNVDVTKKWTSDQVDEHVPPLELPSLQYLEIVDSNIDGNFQSIFKAPNVSSCTRCFSVLIRLVRST